ncbi:MAG: 4Fe-4S double cluster binding domain-containing protein [Thermodesulfobacteriota bacterium]
MGKEITVGSLVGLLEENGFKTRVVPAARAVDLGREFEASAERWGLDGEIRRTYTSGFRFDPEESLPGARSLIITSTFQPRLRVNFTLAGRERAAVIPPTYLSHTDRRIAALLNGVLEPRGLRLVRAALPLKLLAARTGLVRYGRNNVSYAEDWGSFHRLAAFFSEAEPDGDDWGEPAVLDRCQDCPACQKACPTGAIQADRFVVRAERCLTFLNERTADFPDWVSPSWHNCLVGCLVCQRVCPENHQVFRSEEEGPTFSGSETQMLLSGRPPEELPAATRQKLDEAEMMDYYAQLPRNLGVLFRD